MSHHLIVKIILHLREINLQGNFIEDSEKLLEEIELYYTSYLLKFNILLNGKKVDDYCRTLATLGILMHRATYSEGCNCFIF
jgi:hypothetical protein